MPRFFIELDGAALERLSEEAARERRALREQAAWLLQQLLEQADVGEAERPCAEPSQRARQ